MPSSQGVVDVFLNPGDRFVGAAGFRACTMVGAQIVVTLWHPVRRVGAMSHFQVSPRSLGSVLELDGRYGNEAMWLMLRDLINHQVSPKECVATLFGGDAAPAQPECHANRAARTNGEAARRFLQAHRIPIVAESPVTEGQRKIVFDIASGGVWTTWIRPDTGGARFA